MKVLLADNDTAYRQSLKSSINSAGYRCSCAADGLEAANLLEKNSYDIALFEIALPKYDGHELLQYAKMLGVPVIMVTENADVGEKVKCFRAGADDYIVKPFSVRELLARMELVLLRTQPSAKKSVPHLLRYGDYLIFVKQKKVVSDNTQLELTPKEFGLFLLLVQRVGQTVSREQIYREVWGSVYQGETRTIDLHVQRLRSKLGLGSALKSVYGSGYILLEAGEGSALVGSERKKRI